MLIKEILQQDVRGWKTLKTHPFAWLIQEFVLRNGQSFTGISLPRRYRKDTPKYCFDNSQRLMRKRKNLRYFEGYATHNDIGFAFHHAWCVDLSGRIVDVTLEHPEAY